MFLKHNDKYNITIDETTQLIDLRKITSVRYFEHPSGLFIDNPKIQRIMQRKATSHERLIGYEIIGVIIAMFEYMAKVGWTDGKITIARAGMYPKDFIVKTMLRQKGGKLTRRYKEYIDLLIQEDFIVEMPDNTFLIETFFILCKPYNQLVKNKSKPNNISPPSPSQSQREKSKIGNERSYIDEHYPIADSTNSLLDTGLNSGLDNSESTTLDYSDEKYKTLNQSSTEHNNIDNEKNTSGIPF